MTAARPITRAERARENSRRADHSPLTYRTYLHNAELQEHVERQVREALLAEAPAPIRSTPPDVGIANRAAALARCAAAAPVREWQSARV